MKSEAIALVREVLDRQLEDCNGTPCGMVDDVELQESDAGEWRVVALLVGAGAWIPRLPALLRAPARALFGTRLVRVPWSNIEYIREHVRLNGTEQELGLKFRERGLADFIGRLPGGDKTEHA
jgi:hypothetical protein